MIEFLRWGWQELERYEALVCPDGNGLHRGSVAHPRMSVHASAPPTQLPQFVTSEQCYPSSDRTLLH